MFKVSLLCSILQFVLMNAKEQKDLATECGGFLKTRLNLTSTSSVNAAHDH